MGYIHILGAVQLAICWTVTTHYTTCLHWTGWWKVFFCFSVTHNTAGTEVIWVVLLPALVHPCCLCIQLGIWNALKGDRTFLCYSLQGGCLRRLCRCPRNVTDLVNLAQSIALHLSSRAIQILRTVKCTYCMNMAIFWCELANLDSHLSGTVSLHSNCRCRRQLQSVCHWTMCVVLCLAIKIFHLSYLFSLRGNVPYVELH